MSDIYLSITETPAVVTLSQPVISAALSSTVTVANTVTVALDANSLSALENVTVTVGSSVALAAGSAQIGSVTVANLPATQTVQGTVTVGSLPSVSGSVTVNNFPSTQTVQGTVTANTGLSQPLTDTQLRAASVTVAIASLPASTVTARLQDGFGNNLTSTSIGGLNRLNVTLSSAGSTGITAPSYANLHGGSDGTNLRAILTDTSGRTVVTGFASILGTSSVTFTSVSVGSCVTHGVVISNSSVTISGVDILDPTLSATHSLSSLDENFSSNNFGYALITKICSNLGNPINPISNSELRASPVTIGGSVTVSNSVTISALPSGALTTRFGSVTTANTSQLTAAVTNASRKYLLAQNISAGTVTIGIGFSPTTTQGIQLTAGGGLTFDAFCPTGAVYWLGAVTGAAWTILEG